MLASTVSETQYQIVDFRSFNGNAESAMTECLLHFANKQDFMYSVNNAHLGTKERIQKIIFLTSILLFNFYNEMSRCNYELQLLIF